MSDARLKDKSWRISHFYKIKDKQKNLVTFKRNKAQRHFNENKHTRNIILKSRQLGFTTDEAIDMLDETLFEKNSESLLIAQDLDKSKDIFDNKIKLAWDNFKLSHLYEVDLNSARRLKVGFGDGNYSSIVVDLSGRSGTFNRLHITEFAKICKEFPDRAREIIEGSIPAVPLEGRVDIESTAEESFGIFHDIFWEAWNRGEPKHPTQFKAHFYNWRWDEQIEQINPITDLPKEFLEYQLLHSLNDKEISYYYLKFLSLGENDRSWATMKKEFPTTPEEAFTASGEKFFDLNKTLALRTEKPILTLGNWNYYGEYEVGHRYIMGCDVSEGVKRHNSTVVIIDLDYKFLVNDMKITKPKVVAVYSSNEIAPDLFAYEVKSGGQRYGNCTAGVERNNHGFTTLSKLKEIYFNIYMDANDKLGWHTNKSSKPKMMHELRTAVHDGLLIVSDQALKQEIMMFPSLELNETDTNEEDESKGHYDRTIAVAIAWQLQSLATAGVAPHLHDDDKPTPQANSGEGFTSPFNELI